MWVKWVFSGRLQWSIKETIWGVSPLFFPVLSSLCLVLFGGLLSALDSEKARVGARGGEARN